MALKWAGSRVSMSVSHATPRVRLSCASDRSGGKAAPPSAAAPAVIFRNDRRSIRLLMLGLLPASGLLIDRLRPEEDVLRPLQVVLVELADQLLPGRRGEVLLVLLGVADLDPLDVVPARVLGTVDRPLDPVRLVADDARQRLRHLVVVLAQPLLIRGGIDSVLQRRDHVPHLHRTLSLPHPPATGSKQSRRSPSCRTRSFSQAAPFTATSHVSHPAPREARSASMVVSGGISIAMRSLPSGMNRRRFPCMWTVTLIAVGLAPAA